MTRTITRIARHMRTTVCMYLCVQYIYYSKYVYIHYCINTVVSISSIFVIVNELSSLINNRKHYKNRNGCIYQIYNYE